MIMGASGVPTDLGAGTSGQFLKSQGAGANPAWDAPGYNVGAASANLKARADTEVTGTQTSFTLEKSIQVNLAGAVRIDFQIKMTGAGDADGQIYINGVAAGTSRRNSTTTYVNYSEDLYVSAGDRVQLYTMRTGGTSVEANNFRISWDKASAAADYTVILNL